MSGPSPSRHSWKFFRRGGLDQVLLESSADLLALDSLDQKLWVALSCPVRGLELDERTLALIDTDGDGRIRVPELLAAVRWTCARLREPSSLLRGPADLPLEALDASRPEGAVLLACARQVLGNLGRPGAPAVSVADTADSAALFPPSTLNGDGVIQPEAVSDPDLRALVADIIACTGGAPDRSGSTGVTALQIARFYEELAAFQVWLAAGAAPGVQPLGEATAAAVSAVRAVRGKVDDYFTRCRLAAFDERAQAALNRNEADFAAIAAAELTADAPAAAAFPLARCAPGRPLPLGDGSNPAWAGALAVLRTCALEPLLGAVPAELTEKAWTGLLAMLAPYEAWQSAKAGGTVEKLGLPRLRALLASPLRAALDALVAREQALAPSYQAVADLERLARFHRDLRTLLHNFVNFADFYSRDRPAVFQAGTLYLDGRSTELCLRTEGASPLAAMSKLCIATCACTRPGGLTMTIAACFTQGDNDYLFVGRHGVFYDRRGRDWDAEVTSIVDNPTSLRQAAFAPYKKAVRLVEEFTAKRAAAAADKSDATVASAAGAAAAAGTLPQPPAAPPGPKTIDIGTVAAIAVGAGAIGSFVTTLLGFASGWFEHPLAVVGILALISGPAVVIAWIKLSQRTLGPLLDANGWAVNGRVRINFALGSALTEQASFPPGTKHLGVDPYADGAERSRRRRLVAAAVLALVAWIAWHERASLLAFWINRPPHAALAPAAPAPASTAAPKAAS